MAIFERSFNSRRVFDKVRLSSQEFSLLRGASSAPRSSWNHITSRKELDLLLSFGLIGETCRKTRKRDRRVRRCACSSGLARMQAPGHELKHTCASPEARAHRRGRAGGRKNAILCSNSDIDAFLLEKRSIEGAKKRSSAIKLYRLLGCVFAGGECLCRFPLLLAARDAWQF